MQHPPKVDLKKKHTVWVWVGAVSALAVAVALLVLIPIIQKRYPAENQTISVADQPVRTLELTDASRVESVTVYPQGEESYTLLMQDGQLYADTPAGPAQLNQDYATELLKAVTEITVQGVVADDQREVQEHLEEMGLEPPVSRAVVRYADGSEQTIEIGNQVPGTAYSYYRWSGADGVYMCDEGIRDALNRSYKRLLPLTQPEIVGSLLTRLSLDEMTICFDADETGQLQGTLTNPYIYPVSASETQNLVTLLENFRLGTQEPKITEQNKEVYGFDDPLCVVEVQTKEGTASSVDEDGQLTMYQVPAQSLRFVIGREEGDYFYTCEYNGGYYLISRFLAEGLVTANPGGLATRNPANLGDAFITGVSIETAGDTLQVQVSRTQRVLPNNEVETDTDGTALYDTTILFNGETASQERLDELLDHLSQLTVNGDAPANWLPTAQEKPRWTIRLQTEGGQQRVIEAYRLDAFTDVLCVDGVSLHTVDDEAIARILGTEVQEAAGISYVYSTDGDQAGLTLTASNQRFSLSLSLVSSYLGFGTYEEKDGLLLLTTDDGLYHFTFRRVGNNLVFAADQSSDLKPSCVSDGAVFRRE